MTPAFAGSGPVGHPGAHAFASCALTRRATLSREGEAWPVCVS